MPEPERARPVLMVPVRRCGSHALRLRLNNNPDFYAPYPLHIVDFMPLLEKYGDLGIDENYFRLIIDVIGLQTVSMVKWDGVVFHPVKIFDALKEKPRSIHAILWEMLFEAGRIHNARVVMDKSLDSVHYAGELMAMLPDMLFLNVARDPRAQIASMNRAIIHEFDTTLNTKIWVSAHAAALDLEKQYPERVLTIRFEDFVNDEGSVLARICDFMGLEFTPEMVDVRHSVDAQEISRLSALWESNASVPIKANVDKFKKQLSEDEIKIIESLTSRYMDHYGYERMTTSSVEIDPDGLGGARAASAGNRKSAWQRLQFSDNRDFQLRRFRANYIESVARRLEQEPARLTGEALTGIGPQVEGPRSGRATVSQRSY